MMDGPRFPEESPLEQMRALARTALIAGESQRRYAELKLRRALRLRLPAKARALILRVLEPTDPPDPEWSAIHTAVSAEVK